MQGFAVIDLETPASAFNLTDCLCEIGVVLLDTKVQREHSWTTLINPQRDLGV